MGDGSVGKGARCESLMSELPGSGGLCNAVVLCPPCMRSHTHSSLNSKSKFQINKELGVTVRSLRGKKERVVRGDGWSLGVASLAEEAASVRDPISRE